MGTKLHLLNYGHNLADNSIFIAGENPGKRVKIPIMGCYIDHPQAKILVDTGGRDRLRDHHASALGSRRRSRET
jgi:hypothetical protein